MSLLEAKKGQHVKVIGHMAGQHAVSKLAGMGVHVGDELKVIDGGPFGGPVLVELLSSSIQVAIGRGIAKKVLVKSIDDSNAE